MPDNPNPNPNPAEPKQEQPLAGPPKPGPNPAEPKTTDDSKPWGDDFDAQRAWNLTENLRGDKSKLQQQNTELQEQLEELRKSQLTAEQNAAEEAIEAAKAEARSAAEAELRPKYQAAQLRGIAGGVIKDDDKLQSFLAITDPSKFVGEDGDIDQEKVMGHLTALFAADQQQQPPRQWGQHSGNQGPPQRPGDAGLAEAQRRAGLNKQPQ